MRLILFFAFDGLFLTVSIDSVTGNESRLEKISFTVLYVKFFDITRGKLF